LITQLEMIDLVEELPGRPGRRGEVALPFVQPHEAVAAGVAGSSFGAEIYPSSDIDM
jgi:hypothetical protein